MTHNEHKLFENFDINSFIKLSSDQKIKSQLLSLLFDCLINNAEKLNNNQKQVLIENCIERYKIQKNYDNYEADIVKILLSKNKEDAHFVVEMMKLIEDPQLNLIIPNPGFGQDGKNQHPIIKRFKDDEKLLDKLQEIGIIGDHKPIDSENFEVNIYKYIH